MASSTGASPDVLVAGAGPAGSATAVLLARAGFRVTLADRAAFPRDKICSEFLSPEALRVLDRLGVLAELESRGAPLDGMAVTAARGARLEGSFARAGYSPFRPSGLSVARVHLDAALAGAAVAAGATLLERTAVEELTCESGAVSGAVVRDGAGGRRVIHARLTVGADGLRSLVARRLGRRSLGRPRRVAFAAHVAGIAGLGRHAEMVVGERGYAGLNPIGGGITSVALVVPQADVAAARGRAANFFFESLDRFPGLRGRVARAGLVRRILVTGPFAAWSGRVTADGAALVGDAADFFDPFTGEGICSALRGAEMLASAAATALAGPGQVTAAGLAGYRRARRQAFAGKWAVERLIGYGMWFPRLFDRAVGRLGSRAGMADTMIGVTGEFVPARAVLHPAFLARMVL